MIRVSVFISSIALCVTTPVLACDPVDLDEAYEKADNVLVALLFHLNHHDDGSNYDLAFDVQDVLKGPFVPVRTRGLMTNLNAPVEIWSDPPSYFPVNDQYLLFVTDFQDRVLECGQVIRLAGYAAEWYREFSEKEGPKKLLSSNRCRELTSRSDCSLNDVISPKPIFFNGELAGYRVKRGEVRGAYKYLGLEIGDLLTAIDGQTLSDPAVALELLKKLANGQATEVIVERNGTLMTLRPQSN